MANTSYVGGKRPKVVGGVRGSLKPKRKYRTKRRRREDVQIRYIDPEGKAVREDNVAAFCRSMIFDDAHAKPFTTMAEATGKKKEERIAPGTISRLFYGDTQSPSMRTTRKIMGLYGYEMQVVKRH